MSSTVNPRVHPADDWFTPGRFVLLTAAILAACFFSVVIGRETFFFRDYAIFSYPLASYQRECFWRGEIPLWNPYNYCGLPFLAQWNTLVLYPFALFYLVFPLPWSLSVFAIAHLGLAAVGMYLLARTWSGSNLAGAVAGLGFAFGGVALSSLKWPNTIAALAWMPWVVLYCDRAIEGSWRRVGLAAIFAGFQMLCGSPEIVLLTWILCGVIALHRLWIGRSWGVPLKFAAIVILVTTLCAVQLLPFFELLKESQRDESFTGSYWPIPRWGIINFILPLYRTFPSYHGVHAQPWQYWISSYYVGLPLIVLGLFGLIRARSLKFWLLAVVATYSAWLALGDHGLLYRWLRELVPGFSMMRFPVKFVLLPAFIVPVLGAIGVAQALRGPSPKKILAWTASILFPLIFVLCLSNEFNPFPYASAATLSWNAFWRAALATAAIAALLAIHRGSGQVAAAILVSAVALDGITHAPWHNPTAPASVYSEPVLQMHPRPELGKARAMTSPEAAETVDHLKVGSGAEDVRASRASLYCNLNLLEGIPKVDGFFSLYPRWTDEILRRLYDGTNPPPTGVLDFLGVTQITARGSWNEWESRSALPLVSAPNDYSVVSNSVPHILKSSFDPREMVYLQQSPADPVNNAGVTISNIRFGTHDVSFTCETPSNALVVISQSYSEGWRASADGRPIPLLRANHAFQAVIVPPGQHEVQLSYHSRGFVRGGTLSVVGIFILAGLLIFGKREPASERSQDTR